jgi:hypothetical protein
VTSVEAAVEAAGKIGYPCMIRAAFALGGLGSVSNVSENRRTINKRSSLLAGHLRERGAFAGYGGQSLLGGATGAGGKVTQGLERGGGKTEMETQALVFESLLAVDVLQYEVVRDAADNCITGKVRDYHSTHVLISHLCSLQHGEFRSTRCSYWRFHRGCTQPNSFQCWYADSLDLMYLSLDNFTRLNRRVSHATKYRHQGGATHRHRRSVAQLHDGD